MRHRESMSTNAQITCIRTLAAESRRLERRRALKLQQRELALAANVGERFIVDLEAGKPTCQLGKALAVTHALGIRLVDADRRQTAGIGIPDIAAGPQRTNDGRKTTDRE